MTILSIPASAEIQRARFELQYNTMLHQSPLSRTVQRLEIPGAQWKAVYTFTPMRRADAAELLAFLVRLRGAAGKFYGFDPAAKTPRGVATGTPLVNGASQTGTSLITDGWTANTTGILKAGDYIQVNNELKMIRQDINSDSGGNATLLFDPPIRTAPPNNEPIVVNQASCVMRLEDDNQSAWDEDTDGYIRVVISAVETFFA